MYRKTALLLVGFCCIIVIGKRNRIYASPEICDQSPSSDLAEFQGDCYFRDTFESARALFINKAKEIGAELSYFPVSGDLGNDVAVLRGGQNGKVLLHTSGVHGPEGYTGSAIQSAAMHFFAHRNDLLADPDRPTIVFVHAVNPFGFANNRRVNEDNVDVNRNFLTEEQFAEVKARDPNYAGYVDLDFLFNPTTVVFKSNILNEMFEIFRVVYAVVVYGLSTLKKAMVSGNYHKADGISFGGYRMTQSAKNLIEIANILKIPSEAQQVLYIDVHTGLGPASVDTLGAPTDADLDLMKTIRGIFPVEYADKKRRFVGGALLVGGATSSTSKDSALSGYELTIGTTTNHFCRNWLAPNLTEPDRLCIIQEIGTWSPINVGRALIAENYAHFHGSEDEKRYYGERLKGVFLMDKPGWKKKVVRRGLTVLLQGLKHLGLKGLDEILATAPNGTTTATPAPSKTAKNQEAEL